MSTFGAFVVSQLSSKPTLAKNFDESGRVFIVTGSNSGLGKEVVKYFASHGAAKVIMAVRTLSKGETAKKEILSAIPDTNTDIEVWDLDLSSYGSVSAFTERVSKLNRLDAAVLNAGFQTPNWEIAEGYESMVTVNVISTVFLALALRPVLLASAIKHNLSPVITVTGSGTHGWTKFEERKETKLFEAFNDKEKTDLMDRYGLTKLLQLLAFREIAARTEGQQPRVNINVVNPGLCKTNLGRYFTGVMVYVLKLMKFLLAWTAEEGARNLVFGANAGPESHGCYIDKCKIQENELSAFVRSEEGKTAQKKIWSELASILESIQPGITKDLA